MFAVQAPTQPTTASTPVSSSSSNFKKLAVALVVLLGSVAVAFGAFWAFTPSSVVAPLDLPSQNQAILSHIVPKSGSVVAPSVKVLSGLVSYWKPIMAAISLLLILTVVAVVLIVQHSPSVKPVDDVEVIDNGSTTDYEEPISGWSIAGIVLGSLVIILITAGGVYKCRDTMQDPARSDIERFFAKYETKEVSKRLALFRRFAVVSAWSYHVWVPYRNTSIEDAHVFNDLQYDKYSFKYNEQVITLASFKDADEKILTEAVTAAVTWLKGKVKKGKEGIPEGLYQLCHQIMQVNSIDAAGIEIVKQLLDRIDLFNGIDSQGNTIYFAGIVPEKHVV